MVSSQRVGALATVDQLFAGSNGHGSSTGEDHLKEVSLNPRRRRDHRPNFFRRGGSVSCPWSWDPGSSLGVTRLSWGEDRGMHPRFSLEGGVGRARSQESVANTCVLVAFCVCVNAQIFVAG